MNKTDEYLLENISKIKYVKENPKNKFIDQLFKLSQNVGRKIM